MTWKFVPESPVRSPGKINWLGAALMSVGLASVLLAVSQGADWGWLAGKTLALFLFGLVVLAAWVRAELGAQDPLVDMRMMRIKGVWTTNLVAFLLGVGLYASFILVPQLVQLPESTGFGFGASVTQAGVYLLPSAFAMLIFGAMAGKLEALYGSKPPLMVGILAAAASFLLLALAHGSDVDIYLSSLLLGIGIGLAFAAMANLIVQSVRQDQTGVATGMNTVMRSLGGAVGAQAVAAILVSSLAGGLPAESTFTLSFWVCTGALLVAVGVSTLIPGRERPAQAPSLMPARA